MPPRLADAGDEKLANLLSPLAQLDVGHGAQVTRLPDPVEQRRGRQVGHLVSSVTLGDGPKFRAKPGSTERTKQIGMRGEMSRRRRRASEGEHPFVRN